MTLLETIEKQLAILPIEKQGEVLDFILFLHQRTKPMPPPADEERGQRIKTAFQILANSHTFDDIVDPIEWQQQIRKDRNLPGRTI